MTFAFHRDFVPLLWTVIKVDLHGLECSFAPTVRIDFLNSIKKTPVPGLVPEVFSSLVIQGLLVRETDVEFRLILLKY